VVANTADGVTVTCAKLAELITAGSARDRDVINEAEFQAQKSDLLGLSGGGQATVVQPPSVYDVILMAVGPKNSGSPVSDKPSAAARALAGCTCRRRWHGPSLGRPGIADASQS
jgi:hypothetical protein